MEQEITTSLDASAALTQQLTQLYSLPIASRPRILAIYRMTEALVTEWSRLEVECRQKGHPRHCIMKSEALRQVVVGGITRVRDQILLAKLVG